MPSAIKITDDDITYAQNILLPEGMSFDAERRNFLRNLETIDLHASPGSGKTTALLAKLLILAKNLPFKNNSGILVLSHTNSAVDEIHSKIYKHCPHLFNYPNYVGTIQSFVNKFLAVPCYSNTFNKKPSSIDHEIYCERVLKYRLPYGANAWVSRQSDPSSFLTNIRLDNELNLVSGLNGTPERFALKNTGSDTYKALYRMKCKLLESGNLHYDDAYFLASQYLNDFAIAVLRNRFSHIFVDEMQDMDTHQHDLMENIFFGGDCNKSIFQRIGDKNQSIYNGSVSLDGIWSDRENTLNLNGSHRLTENVAEMVNCFALDRDAGFHIKGLREGGIKPYLIVYDNASIEQVVPTFSEIINGHIENNELPKNNGKYKAIAWIKNHDHHIALSDYYPKFNNSIHTEKTDHCYLTNYIYCYDNSVNSLKAINKNIISILLKILRMEDVINSDTGNCFTKTSLLKYLAINHKSYYDILKSNLYLWSINVTKNEKNEAINSIREHIPVFLSMFNREITDSSDFIFTDGPEEILENITENKVNIHGFDIEITTIHSAKGQTHTGTLYLESYYQGDYETHRLSEQFCGDDFNDARTYHKQSTKMAYVGLSRPTHLLCVAIHRERYDALNEDLDRHKWEVRVI